MNPTSSMPLLPLLGAVCGVAGVGGLLLAAAGWAGWRARPAGARRTRTERRVRALLGTDGGRARALWWAGRRARALAAAAVTAGVWAGTSLPLAGVLAGMAVASLGWMLNPGREHAARIARLEALEEWVRRMSDIHQVGITLEQAVASSLRTVPAAIAPEVGHLVARLRAGTPPAQAYRAFGDDLADATADMVVALMLLHVQDRGAGLGRALKALTDAVAEEVLMRRKVEADRAKPRANARWITLFCLTVFALSLALPVATARNAMPSPAATRSSKLPPVPTHSTSTAWPPPASRACSARIAVSAG